MMASTCANGIKEVQKQGAAASESPPARARARVRVRVSEAIPPSGPQTVSRRVRHARHSAREHASVSRRTREGRDTGHVTGATHHRVAAARRYFSSKQGRGQRARPRAPTRSLHANACPINKPRGGAQRLPAAASDRRGCLLPVSRAAPAPPTRMRVAGSERALAPRRTHVHTHARTHKQARTQAHARTHARTYHTHSRTHTLARKHTHTRTCTPAYGVVDVRQAPAHQALQVVLPPTPTAIPATAQPTSALIYATRATAQPTAQQNLRRFNRICDPSPQSHLGPRTHVRARSTARARTCRIRAAGRPPGHPAALRDPALPGQTWARTPVPCCDHSAVRLLLVSVSFRGPRHIRASLRPSSSARGTSGSVKRARWKERARERSLSVWKGRGSGRGGWEWRRERKGD